MSIFSTVKTNVTTRMAAEHYGLQVDHNGKARCPFHNDKHPSMKVDDRYYCFGCHATGDVIDYVGKLFNLTPLYAAKKIAVDFGLDPNTPVSMAQRIPECFTEQQYRRRALDCLSIMINFERLLKEQKERYAPINRDAQWDERFVSACNSLPYVTYLVDRLLDCDKTIQMQTVDELLADGTAERIRHILTEQQMNDAVPDAA